MMPTANEVRTSLTDDQRSLLAAIVAARLVWSDADRFDDATITELEVLELVVRWQLPTEEVITLTSWGAYVLGVEIDERLQTISGFHVEVPFWVEAGEGSEEVVLPKYPKEVRNPFPERAPAPEPIDEPEPEPEPPPVDSIVGQKILGVEVQPDRRSMIRV